MNGTSSDVFGLEALGLLAFLVIGTHALQGGVIRPTSSGIFSLCVALLTLAKGLQTHIRGLYTGGQVDGYDGLQVGLDDLALRLQERGQ